jgi:hypothetical protein
LVWCFSLLNKSDPRNHTKFRGGSARSLPARTRKLRVRTFLQKDTTGLIQSIMRIGLHSPRSSGDKPIG